jgi:hypothetical protein
MGYIINTSPIGMTYMMRAFLQLSKHPHICKSRRKIIVDSLVAPGYDP